MFGVKDIYFYLGAGGGGCLKTKFSCEVHHRL